MAAPCQRISSLRSAVSSIGSNFCSIRSRRWRQSGTRCSPRNRIVTPPPAAMLLAIKGIGPDFAAILWSEGLYRHFDNQRQIASYAGLAPTPWQSGSIDREQGVSKAGNSRLRTTLIQLAWLWLRHQPQSALALWFKERVLRNGGRFKKSDHRRVRAKTARRALEICHRRRRHRGSHNESPLTVPHANRILVIFQDRLVLADPGGRTAPNPWL